MARRYVQTEWPELFPSLIEQLNTQQDPNAINTVFGCVKKICKKYKVLAGDVALRGVYIIDPDGIVQSGTVNNLPVGRNLDEVLRTLQAYQYVKSSGNVCPANWKQGDEGMAASLDGVKNTIG